MRIHFSNTRQLNGLALKSLLMLAAFTISHNECRADRTLLYDDFSDGSIDDGSPATWADAFLAFSSTTVVQNGDLSVTIRPGSSPVTVIPTNAGLISAENPLGLFLARDTSTFLQMQFGAGFTGALGSASPQEAYLGGVRANNEIWLGQVAANGEIPWFRVGQLPFDITATDLFVQFDIIGDELSLRAWPVGTEKPSAPLVVTENSTQSGNIGLALTSEFGGLPGQATFRSFESIERGTHGDFNGDNVIDDGDYQLLSDQLQSGETRMLYDVTDDGFLNEADRTVWIRDIFNTYAGDANLDGEFNSSDFVTVFAAGQYEDGILTNSDWQTGDWNGDFEFDSGDLVIAFQEGGYERGPKPRAVAVVPEPSSVLLLSFGFISVAFSVGRRC